MDRHRHDVVRLGWSAPIAAGVTAMQSTIAVRRPATQASA
jgi:hypothetical protein